MIRVGIQKGAGEGGITRMRGRSKCDNSILGELLKEELWLWTRNGIDDFGADFELGNLELDITAALVVSRVSNNITTTATRTATNSAFSQHSSQHVASSLGAAPDDTIQCSQDASVCQHWIAPLRIIASSHHRGATTTSMMTRGNNNNNNNRNRNHNNNPVLFSKMAERIKSVLYTQLPLWMTDNTVLIGTTCASDMSSLQVSVEILGGYDS
jgi:hypothetical protein